MESGLDKEVRPVQGRNTRTVFRRLSTPALPGWAILPLRLFLGFSFLAAGLDKLGDPAFLDPASRDYIGKQIARFAPGTPLEGFLLNFAVPNAGLFGILVMGGEICIAIAVLLGLLTRFSAFMGMLLNLTFFLSATWSVQPFYFGADLPYTVAWLTLLLAGPGPLSLDEVLSRLWAAPPEMQSAALPEAPESAMTRRAFLTLAAAGMAGATLASISPLWGVLHPRRAEARVTPTPTPAPATTPVATVSGQDTPTLKATPPEASASETPVPAEPTPVVQAQATPTAAATGGVARQQLAAAGALPMGKSLEFALPTGQPAVLVHNDSGYSAYVAVCTHNGCIVHATPDAELLVCPCHGAEFDPKANARIVKGPAPRPLSPVPISVDPDGSVYLAG
jgi:thiosulfate dehydrogenase (quinone) large subunit